MSGQLVFFHKGLKCLLFQSVNTSQGYFALDVTLDYSTLEGIWSSWSCPMKNTKVSFSGCLRDEGSSYPHYQPKSNQAILRRYLYNLPKRQLVGQSHVIVGSNNPQRDPESFDRRYWQEQPQGLLSKCYHVDLH